MMERIAVRLGFVSLTTALLAGGWCSESGPKAVAAPPPPAPTPRARSAPAAGGAATVPAPRVSPRADSSTPAAVPSSQTLVIVAEGESGVKATTLQTQIQQGVNLVLRKIGVLGPTESFEKSKIDPVEIDEETYVVLKRFITEGTIPRDEPKNQLEMARDRGDAWRLDLGGPSTLQKLVVEYSNDKHEKDSKEFAPGIDDHVRLITLGRYLINGVKHTDSRMHPLKFTIDYVNDGKEQSQEIEAPADHTYWQIAIRDYSGDQKELFEELASKKFGNPLVSTHLSERKLVLGSMITADIIPPVTGSDNIVRFNFVKPPNASPTRVWMKFPLEPEDVEKELEHYRSNYDYFELPKQIEKESLSPAGEKVKLAPKPAPARWYEVPLTKDELRFEREFELDQIDAWKARADKGVYRLIVWIQDSPGVETHALLLTEPGNERKWPVSVEEIKKWPSTIKAARVAPPEQ